jgi:hypothetical protein
MALVNHLKVSWIDCDSFDLNQNFFGVKPGWLSGRLASKGLPFSLTMYLKFCDSISMISVSGY